MRICVFQSCFEELQASVGDAQELCMNPGPFTTQHVVSHKTILKSSAKEQIDEAIQEGHDFYLNFMWGTHDDSLAGVDAIRYFESFNLPSAGVQSSEREQSKWDFFAEAKRAGSPLVPGTEKFPLFVKPASSYGSMFIDEYSLCHNETELTRCIERLNRSMRPVRIQRAQALACPDPEKYADAREAEGRDSTDIVVQEFIDGEEYSVVVIAMGESPFPLIPQRAKYKKGSGDARFLTLDLKFDAESGYELLSKREDPDLYKHLQETAIEAFTTKKMYTNCMGCDVDMRIGRDGRAYVIEVDPLPVFFYPTGSQLEDTDVKYGFPGGYRAVVNTYITNYFLKSPGPRGTYWAKLTTLFDESAPSEQLSSEITTLGPYTGTAIDLGCGTGLVGRLLHENPGNQMTHLIGVDISNKMLDICHQGGRYSELLHDRMEKFLGQRTEMVDHIFSLLALDFLSVEELDFVLARCFQLSRNSITLMIQDYEKTLTNATGPPKTFEGYCEDHAERIKTFQIPPGWQLQTSSAGHLCRERHRMFYFVRD
ncbi:hypothetical protein N7462_000383 [Penicillium macrosclerotiorum]|uniref:uncharacterized protein n=1 Tax=Penicillium macrosclerotiorum TaxID=303699 RepID=UPI0025490F8E|nr:uncharacterized protein N7462_000383 [Penicillium macrosclerotiorum]KAJ5698378.1 hypothetical protein N7462_000383 [Penicillium macrosclerotiorum]